MQHPAPARLPEILGFWTFAQRHPDKPALIVEPGARVTTYGELDRLANRYAHGFRA